MEIGAITNNFFQTLEKSVQEALKNDKVFQSIASCEEGLDVFSGSHIYTTKDKSGNQISLELIV